MAAPDIPGTYVGEVRVVAGKAWVWTGEKWTDRIPSTAPPQHRSRRRDG